MIPALPVTVIGGYLGSGKTTLVNHLLRHANGVRLAVLVNEFGDLAIDQDLIEATGDDIISIAGGCVCCSFGNDLTAALMDLSRMAPPPDHILIEASGVAIPGAIAAAIGLLDGFSSDGVVVVADAETIRRHAGDKYMGDTVTRQLHDADIILLNKADLVGAEDLKATRSWLSGQSLPARVIETVQGAVAPAVVLGSHPARIYQPAPHHEATNLDMLTLRPKGRVDVDHLAEALTDKDCGLIRAKGFATSVDGKKTLVQVVGHRWRTSPASGDVGDGIICLGFRGEMNRARLSRLLTG